MRTHKCNQMPDNIACIEAFSGKLGGFIHQKKNPNAAYLYGMEFCPYCGAKLKGENNVRNA